MKKLKFLSIVVFAVSLLLFGGYLLKGRTTKNQAAPVITMETDDIQVSVKDGREALLKGVTASDAHGNDISDVVRVESVSSLNEEGKRIVRYVVFDSDGRVTHALRTMSYTDYTEPVFEITKPLTFSTEVENLLEGVTAQDCIDGDISDRIQILFDGETDTAKPGIYPARLKVKNSAGGTAEIPVVYEIYKNADYGRHPELNLTQYLVYLKKGEKFSASDYLKTATINGTEYSFVNGDGTFSASEDSEGYTIGKKLVTVTGEVDTNTSGCYEIDYSLNDEVFGTGTGMTRLYVMVMEGGTE